VDEALPPTGLARPAWTPIRLKTTDLPSTGALLISSRCLNNVVCSRLPLRPPPNSYPYGRDRGESMTANSSPPSMAVFFRNCSRCPCRSEGSSIVQNACPAMVVGSSDAFSATRARW
jgi:hypothetical protein